MRYRASSMARCWVMACRPALAIEYADDGVAAMACRAHMLPMLTMAPPCPPATIPRGHGLGEQEHGPVQLQVAVVVGGGVLEERQRPEHAGGVDQQGGVG